MARCPKCGGKIEDDLMGCLKCGYKPYFERNNKKTKQILNDYTSPTVDKGNSTYDINNSKRIQENTYSYGDMSKGQDYKKTKTRDRSRSIFDTNPSTKAETRYLQNNNVDSDIEPRKFNIIVWVLLILGLLIFPMFSFLIFILSMILMKQDNPYKDEWKKVAIVCVVMFVIFAVFGGLISLLYSLMFF